MIHCFHIPFNCIYESHEKREDIYMWGIHRYDMDGDIILSYPNVHILVFTQVH